MRLLHLRFCARCDSFPLSGGLQKAMIRAMMLEESLSTRSALLAELVTGPAEVPKRKRRKLVENKQPRRGDPDGVGEARWRIPIGRDVWDELRKPERYDESSWDGKRFQSIYGVPARMFDELVAEAAKHPTLCKKVTWGDGVKGPLPKPLELKVAAVLCFPSCVMLLNGLHWDGTEIG